MSGVSRHKFRVPTKGALEDFFLLIKGSERTLWLIAEDQDGWGKSWKSVHCFIITFLTIYFLGKIIWQLFAKMGHPSTYWPCRRKKNRKNLGNSPIYGVFFRWEEKMGNLDFFFANLNFELKTLISPSNLNVLSSSFFANIHIFRVWKDSVIKKMGHWQF